MDAPVGRYEFGRVWRSLESAPEKRCAYLTGLSAANVGKIFRSSLEAETLCEISKTLAEAAASDPKQAAAALSTLRALSKVERFGTIMMMASDAERSLLAESARTLIGACSEGAAPAKRVGAVRKAYGV